MRRIRQKVRMRAVQSLHKDSSLTGVWPGHHRDKAPAQEHHQLAAVHSMTSSASIRIECGIVSPSVLAVFKLTTSSNVVGRCTGRSGGLGPLGSFPAYMPG